MRRGDGRVLTDGGADRVGRHAAVRAGEVQLDGAGAGRLGAAGELDPVLLRAAASAMIEAITKRSG